MEFCWISFSFLVFAQRIDLAGNYKINDKASCTSDQIEECGDAARSGKLSFLKASGTCRENGFNEYTHVCEKKSPSGDYCCCIFKKQSVCCRYLDSNVLFRCKMPADTVEQFSDSSTPRLEILIPAVTVPIALILCCLFCCLKSKCYEDEYDDEKVRTSCLCSNREDKNDPVPNVGAAGLAQYAVAPSCNRTREYRDRGCLNCGPQGSSGFNKIPLDALLCERERPHPSAPLLELGGARPKQRVLPSGGNPSSGSQQRRSSSDDSLSNNSSTGQRLYGQPDYSPNGPCPPPAYYEALDHPIMEPHTTSEHHDGLHLNDHHDPLEHHEHLIVHDDD